MIALFHLVRRALCRTSADAWSGEGAYLYGDRWNAIGTRVSYAGSTRSLCALEVLVHIDISMIPADYVISVAELPEKEVAYLVTPPTGWNAIMRNADTIAIGEAFIREGKTVALGVPSAVVPQEWNYLINPRHPRCNQLVVHGALEPFAFDQRLVWARKKKTGA